ncbi:MAG: DsbA family oxidoreductase [Mangrovicoccus sp.]
MIPFDIISDPICPWCFIGKTTLDRALELTPDHPFEIEWHPFQLNPDMPPEGMPRRAYLEQKFGGKDNALKVYGEIDAKAREEGLELNFEAIEKTPNTLNAHRLIFWAGIEKCQNQVVQSIFEAYFLEGRDISDLEVLADIADSAGIDAALVLRLLKTDEDLAEVRLRDKTFRDMGVTSVPTYLIAREHAVPGVQATELWTKVIEEAKAVA